MALINTIEDAFSLLAFIGKFPIATIVKDIEARDLPDLVEAIAQAMQTAVTQFAAAKKQPQPTSITPANH